MKFFDEILNINEFIKSPVRTLSLGQRMRADIVASLLHNPKVLYLDEPTIGLDVVAKQKMREAIKQMNNEYNTTVILTTHDIDDIEMLCNRIMIIDEGVVIYDGSLQEIKDRYGYMRIAKFELTEALDFDLHLSDEFGLEEKNLHYTVEDNSVIVEFNRKLVTVSKISQYLMSKVDVKDLNITDAKIEDIVRRIYEKGSAEL
jgi:ABC-2 type transport system ATP-binding protein